MARNRLQTAATSGRSDEDRDAARLGHARFVLLTTYRASGAPVATPVWIVSDADQVAVLTNADSGKVRRLRNNPSVTLVPCTPRGKPSPAASLTHGHAEIRADDDGVAHLWKLIRRKYAVAHLVLRVLGLIKSDWNRWKGPQVALQITLEPG